jgi:hypothetical protein
MNTRSSNFGAGSRREWNLRGYEVAYIHIDYRFAFDCRPLAGDNGSLSVVIEAPFQLIKGAAVHDCDPSLVDSLGVAIQILHQPTVRLAATADGTLLVEFDGGIAVKVERHEQFEAWEAHGSGELSAISLLCSPYAVPPWGGEVFPNS